MTIIAFVPALVAIAGALGARFAKHPDTKQIALYAFACGLLVTLFGMGHAIRIG